MFTYKNTFSFLQPNVKKCIVPHGKTQSAKAFGLRKWVIKSPDYQIFNTLEMVSAVGTLTLIGIKFSNTNR